MPNNLNKEGVQMSVTTNLKHEMMALQSQVDRQSEQIGTLIEELSSYEYMLGLQKSKLENHAYENKQVEMVMYAFLFVLLVLVFVV